MKLKKLIKNLNYKRLENIVDYEIKGISCNSNSVQRGYLFVAIKGTKKDGHSFTDHAIKRGAKAIILQKDLPMEKRVAKILVQNSRAALARVCASFFGHPARNLKAIGITGTNGKTTISYLIEKILFYAGYPCGVIGTVNYRLGNRFYVPANTTPTADILQAFLQEIVLAKSKYAIMEVSSHALAQHRVDCVDFSTAVFTNLSPEHLDYHGSLTNYFSCKLSLFERLNRYSWAIINNDDPYGRKLLKKINCQLLTYGVEHPAHIQAKDLKLKIERTRFKAVTARGTMEIESPLIGKHNVYNILAAISAAFIENIDFSHIVMGIRNCIAIPGRLERIECKQSLVPFVDYAHTTDALKKILQTLRQICKSKIILVFGCGGDRDKTKRPLMGKVATELSDFVILTTDNPRSEDPRGIISDIEKGIGKEVSNYKVVLDRFQAIQEALRKASNRDVVIIAGKGHESRQIFANKTIQFNDSKAAKKILLTN